MKVTIKQDFLVRHVAGENVLIGSGEQINFSKMLLMNDTAVDIVKALQKSATLDELALGLTERYEVSYEEAVADVKTVVEQLEEQGVVVVGEAE